MKLPRLLAFFALFLSPAMQQHSSFANVCLDDVTEQSRQEAAALESELFTTAYDGTANLSSLGTPEEIREYHARLITCNRKRDTKGNEINRALAESPEFAQDLPPKSVEGAYNWFGGGIFSQFGYGYILSREAGEWIVTVPIAFHWPGSRLTDRIDIPQPLAESMALAEPGQVCHSDETVFNEEDPRKIDFGLITWELRGAQQQAFIEEQQAFNDQLIEHNPRATPIPIIALRDDVPKGSVQHEMLSSEEYDLTFSGSACRLRRDTVAYIRDNEDTEENEETVEKSVLNHLRDYWKLKIEEVWSREGFKIRVKFINCEDAPAGTPSSCDPSVTEKDVKAWAKDDSVYNVHFNLIPMHRALYKKALWKWDNLYSGSEYKLFAHELGHYMGLDDEYSEKIDSKKDTGCEDYLPGARSKYFMCDQGTEDSAQGVYPWIITRRYSIAKDFQCDEDQDCATDRFCDKGGLLGIGRNTCEPKRLNGGSCSREEICAEGLTCRGEPVGTCRRTEGGVLGSACERDLDCLSGNCDSGICLCKKSSDCGGGQYCDTGTLGVGANTCVDYKEIGDTCSSHKQCESPARCAGAAPRRCVVEKSAGLGDSCVKDAECEFGKCGSNKICVCTEDAHCWPDQCIKKPGKPNACGER